MAHFATADMSQSVCTETETEEFDVMVSGETVATGPQPNDYCSACGAVEPEWIELTEEEFLKRWPL
jgi:hypothetical protein